MHKVAMAQLWEYTHPFLRSSKTLSIYVEFPRLFNQNRNDVSSLEIWVSSGISRKDICFAWVERPFLKKKKKTYIIIICDNLEV